MQLGGHRVEEHRCRLLRLRSRHYSRGSNQNAEKRPDGRGSPAGRKETQGTWGVEKQIEEKHRLFRLSQNKTP